MAIPATLLALVQSAEVTFEPSAVEFVVVVDDVEDVCIYRDGTYETSVYRGDRGFSELEQWWKDASADIFDDTPGDDGPEGSYWVR